MESNERGREGKRRGRRRKRDRNERNKESDEEFGRCGRYVIKYGERKGGQASKRKKYLLQ